MGTTSSSSSSSGEDAHRQRIRNLGEKYPFSDAELEILYRCHRNRKLSRGKPHQGSVTGGGSSGGGSMKKISFFQELAVCALAPEERDLYEAMLTRIGQLEQDIFTAGFSNSLKKVIFGGAASCGGGGGGGGYASSSFGGSFSSEGTPTPSYPNNKENSLTSSFSFDDSRLTVEEFLDGLTKCFGRRGNRSALEVLFACCCQNGELSKGAKAIDLITLGYHVAVATDCLAAGDATKMPPRIHSNFADGALTSMAASLERSASSFSSAGGSAGGGYYGASGGGGGFSHMSSSSIDTSQTNELIPKDAFIAWAESTSPLFSATLPTFFHRLLFRHKILFSPTRQPFMFPDLVQQSSAFFRTDQHSPKLFSLACMSLSLNGKWHRLYTTDSDGLSFNRLQNALLGYGGPTLMMIRATDGNGTFGAFTSEQWKESKDFYGSSDCFLYRLEPGPTGVFRPRGMEGNYMYCNSEARSKGYDGLAHGIGFGGSNLEPRLFISEKFEGNVAASRCMTYEPGALLPKTDSGAAQKYFEIESLEVWGVGGDEVVSAALGARVKQREIADANVRKAKKVDKAAFLDDLRSGLIESKAFKHREEMRGREGCDGGEEDLPGGHNHKQ